MALTVNDVRMRPPAPDMQWRSLRGAVDKRLFLHKYVADFTGVGTSGFVIELDFIYERVLKEVLGADYPAGARSVLLYQAGQVLELAKKETAEALRQYLLSLKLEDDFSLPVLAAGSILLATGSHQRLTRLYQAALERSSGRSACMLRLFLAEYLDVAPVEGVDRETLIAEISASQPDRVLALALLEWEKLARSDRAAHIDVLEQWKDGTGQPVFSGQVRLELARRFVDDGRHDRARTLVEEVHEIGASVFPRFAETLRLALAAGDRRLAVRLALDEARRILGAQPGEPVEGGLLLPGIGDQASAASRLVTLAWLLSGPDPSILDDGAVREPLDAIIEMIQPAGIVGTGLDGLLFEYLLGQGRHDALERHLAATADGLVGIDKAWNLWCQARASLAAGRFDDLRGRITALREAGYGSRILDAVESLGTGGAATPAPGDDTDRFGAVIALDGLWAGGEDPARLARRIAEMEDLGGGVSDIAYVIARIAGDSFLRLRAVAEWARSAGPRSEAAIMDLVRLHGFERPNARALCDAVLSFGPGTSTAHLFAALAAVRRLVPEGRAGEIEPVLATLVSHALDMPREGASVAGILRFVTGQEHSGGERAPDRFGPLEIHDLIRSAADPRTAGRAVRWMTEGLSAGTPGLDPPVAGAAALLALRADLPPEQVASLAGILLEPRSGLDAHTRLVLALRLADPARVLVALDDLASEIGPGPARSSLRLVSGLRRLFEGGDADEALGLISDAARDDPGSAEAQYALALLGPAAGMWQDVVIALDRLVGRDAGDTFQIALMRMRMILGLVVEKDMAAASDRASAILDVRGGDPLSIVVKMASARHGGDLGGFMSEMGRLSLWFGDPEVKGKLAHRQVQLAFVGGAIHPARESEDTLPSPDPVNMSTAIAPAVLNGPVDLTESRARAALDEAGLLEGIPHKAGMLVETGDLLEAAGQSRLALEAFTAALGADPLEPLAIEGVMRLAPELQDHAAMARALEARAGLASDTRRRVHLLVRAAEEYARDKSTAEQAAHCYQEAADLDPSDPRSLAGILRALELRGDIRGVIDILERRVASAIEGDEIEAIQLKIADLKRRSQDYDGALVALDDLLIVQPGKITAWRMKLDLLLQVERFEDALEAADDILDRVEDRATRVAVLHKCISVSLARLKDLDRGLGYCLRLVSEGEADEDLVNKTMRLALRLERWEEAAALQEAIASRAPTQAQRHALLIKKAEIHLRYAKDPIEAERVYRKILDENPLSWEAFMRWHAARGAEGLSRGEAAPYIESVQRHLESNPLDVDGITFLVKAFRVLRDAGAARYHDAILSLVRGDAVAGAPPPRASMAPVIAPLPQGTLPRDELEDLIGMRGPGSFVAEVLGCLGEGGGLGVLEKDGALAPAVAAEPYDIRLPLGRVLAAWGVALGIDHLSIVSASGLEEGVRIVRGPALAVDASLAHPVAEHVLFRAGAMLGLIARGSHLMAMMEADRITELVKAGLMAAGARGGLDPADGTPELAERLRRSCSPECLGRLARIAEAPPVPDAASVIDGQRSLVAGILRAGILVSASVPGLLAYYRGLDQPLLSGAREFFESDALLREGLGYALSPRYIRHRRLLDLEF